MLLAYLERLQLPRKTSPDANHKMKHEFCAHIWLLQKYIKKKKKKKKKGEQEQRRIEEKHSNTLKSHFLRIWGPLRAHSYADTQ